MKTLLASKVSLLAAALLVSACATGTDTAALSADNAQKVKYEQALAKAQSAVDQAASVGGEWRDIRWKKSKKKYLPSAEKAAKAGDYATAMKLLNIVQFQAEEGYKQVTAQKSAGPRF